MSTKKKIFLSYPSKSRFEALELRRQLDPDKYSVWNDDYIKAGDPVGKRLHGGFLDSDYCVLLLTEHTEKSPWCMQEVGAFWGAEKPIIVYRPHPKVSLPPFLADKRAANNFDELVRALDDTPPSDRLVREVFARAGGGTFENRLDDLAKSAKRIRLIGTGLEILAKPNFRDLIITRASKGECVLEVYLADPFSPAVESRLVEEDLGRPVPVPVGRQGIIDLANKLTTQWREAQAAHAEFEVSLFTHGPTFALLAFDDTYFFYPYGCTRLGNFSPAFELRSGVPKWNEVIHFFDHQIDRVKQSSTSLARLTAHGKSRVQLDPCELWPFALYYVPPSESALYTFGTSVLGYDVRNKSRSTSKWDKYVGKAKSFGFHLTVCDALYFLTAHERRTAIAEAKFIMNDFHEFEISDFEIKAGVPDDRSISLVPRDSSGTLEALNYEFVSRIYRRAVASTYTLGLAKSDRDDDLQRANLMIKKYLAPYILSRFRPHFSLLTDVPLDEQEKFQDDLTKLLEEHRSRELIRLGIDPRGVSEGMSIFVDQLAVMSTRSKVADEQTGKEEKKDGEYWVIKGDEISLKSRSE